MPISQPSPKDRISAVFTGQPLFPVPRGELWLGRALFERAGLTDTVENHFRLAARLGQEIVCLPVAHDLTHAPNLGYRYFDIADLAHAPRSSHRFVAAVVDGPFQALVNRQGMIEVLTAWMRRRQEVVEAYAAQQRETMMVIDRCLTGGVDAVVMADDLAADRGTLISPTDIESLCAAFYTQAFETIHEAGAKGLIHCCGDIKTLMPLFEAWGTDGVAAVQNRVNDLGTLKRSSGAHLVIMAGIDAELLESDAPPEAALKAFEQVVRRRAPAGGLILGSCCGLYHGDFLPRIERLYRMADRLAGRRMENDG